MNEAYGYTADEISRSVEEIIRKRPDYSGMLSLYEKIFIAQEECKSGIKLNEFTIPDNILSLKMKEKLPLVDISQFVIDTDSSKKLFKKICTILSDSETGLSGSLDRLADLIDDKKLDLDELFTAILRGDDSFFYGIEEKYNIDKKLLGFILYNSIKPSVSLFSRRITEKLPVDAEWEKGYCPVCGSLPEFSLFGENGKRFLICGFCNHKWRSKRVYCPFCENTDHNSLHYFDFEDEEEYRVDVCDNCRKYIKTIDTKKTIRLINPHLEYLSTPHIDIRLEEMGFRKGTDQE